MSIEKELNELMQKEIEITLNEVQIEAALATKGIAKSLPGYPKVSRSFKKGQNLMLELTSGIVLRVSISDLPDEMKEEFEDGV